LVLPSDDRPDLALDNLLIDEEESISSSVAPKIATWERLYGLWARSFVQKMNLEHVSGYNFGGPEYLFKDKKERMMPCEIKYKGGQMTAIGQLRGYISEYNSPFGILVLGGTFHQTWLRQWRRVRRGLPDEQGEEILFLLL